MDMQRVQEIMNSKETIDVLLQGQPVWIDMIDAANNQVEVHLQSKPEQRKSVPPTELMEVH